MIGDKDVRRYGYSRDHRGDRRQIVIGMVTTRDGIPIAHHVFPGNTLDRKTVEEVVKDLRERLGLSKVTFVGVTVPDHGEHGFRSKVSRVSGPR